MWNELDGVRPFYAIVISLCKTSIFVTESLQPFFLVGTSYQLVHGEFLAIVIVDVVEFWTKERVICVNMVVL